MTVQTARKLNNKKALLTFRTGFIVMLMENVLEPSRPFQKIRGRKHGLYSLPKAHIECVSIVMYSLSACLRQSSGDLIFVQDDFIFKIFMCISNTVFNNFHKYFKLKTTVSNHTYLNFIYKYIFVILNFNLFM